MRVAQSLLCHLCLQRFGECRGKARRREKALGVKRRKRSQCLGKFHGALICRAAHESGNAVGRGARSRTVIALAQHRQGIGQPKETQADAPGLTCSYGLLGERPAGHINDPIEQFDAGAHQPAQRRPIERCLRCEGVVHQAAQVDRAQRTRPPWRQGLLATGIGGGNDLGV